MVSLEELRDLFTGVPDEDGGWATTPCYRVPLAYEIARRARAGSEFTLRSVIYDTTAVDDIPREALEVIALAAQHYRQWRGRQQAAALGTGT